ncbi:unnamed protein product [Ceratitis capitata]|uniref:(Mediterranean fruit fly) hypothetical protein n=1 Tax=Ceratitis capitata TaxID=7213 RepID=A0A811V2N9_CERCA|nr:unnamed protein product [Ceratitis capitata]
MPLSKITFSKLRDYLPLRARLVLLSQRALTRGTAQYARCGSDDGDAPTTWPGDLCEDNEDKNA